jgi:hypothetical protein
MMVHGDLLLLDLVPAPDAPQPFKSLMDDAMESIAGSQSGGNSPTTSATGLAGSPNTPRRQGNYWSVIGLF